MGKERRDRHNTWSRADKVDLELDSEGDRHKGNFKMSYFSFYYMLSVESPLPSLSGKMLGPGATP